MLAKHPAVEEKVRAEVEEKVPDISNISWDTIQSLE